MTAPDRSAGAFSDAALGATPKYPDFNSRLVAASLVAHLAIAVALTAVVALVVDGPIGDEWVWYATAISLVPLAAILVTACRAPERGNVGEILIRSGFHLPVLLVPAVVEAPLILAAGAFGRDGLDYVMGGAVLGAVGVGLAGCVALLLLGAAIAFPLGWGRDLPLHLRASIPLFVGGLVLMATAAGLAVERQPGDRRLEPLGDALFGGGEVISETWVLVTRLAAVAFVLGIVSAVAANRRLRER